MKLSYRGTSYQQTQMPLEVQEGDIAGKYRGQEWKYRYPRHIPQSPPKLYRQYRGVAYSSRPLNHTETVTYPKLCAGKTCSVPCRQPIVNYQTSQVHIENMRRNLDRRLKIALDNGDNDLVRLLQQESEQLAI